MRLLITGGAGYIGSHIVLSAIENGFDITVFDDLSSGWEDNVHSSAEFILGSTLDKSDINNLMSSRKFDIVIHLAGSKSSSHSMINPLMYFQNNIVSSINVIQACVEYGIEYFVFSSSAAVYGAPKYLPIDEKHPLAPNNYYGYTKLCIEDNLKWYSEIFGLKYASLRYFNAAGYDLNKRIKSIETDPQNLIPRVMETAIGNTKSVKIYGKNYKTIDGTAVRDYVHVSDLARAHLDALSYLHNQRKNIVVNLGTGSGYSVLEVVEKIRKISNKNFKYIFCKRRNGDPHTTIAKSSLARELISWETKISDLDTIIRSTWEVYNAKLSL